MHKTDEQHRLCVVLWQNTPRERLQVYYCVNHCDVSSQAEKRLFDGVRSMLRRKETRDDKKNSTNVIFLLCGERYTNRELPSIAEW